MKKTFTTVLIVIAFAITAQSQTNWVQGSWGVRLIVSGGSKLDGGVANSDWVAGAQEIVDDLPSVGHVITNFTHPAHGYHFTLRTNPNVNIAQEIHPDFVPSLQNEKVILEVIDILRKAGKKVILYIATDGPSATGGTPDNAEYKAAWKSYYTNKFDGNEGAAWRDLTRGFAERFKGLADGYWLDHTNKCPGGINSFISMLRDVDPTLKICANGIEENIQDTENYMEYSNGTEMQVSVDGPNDPDSKNYKIKSFNTFNSNVDFTSGHPTPLAHGAQPNSWAYEEFTFPEIIAETANFNASTDLVKHAWMPMRMTWTGNSSALMFEKEQAYRFVRTLIDGNCSFTWGNTQTNGKITPVEMAMMKVIDSRLRMNPMPDYIPYTRPSGAKLVGEDLNNRYQVIYSAQLPTKKVGDADFATGALASSGLTVTTTSSNTSVAKIVNNKIRIVGAGTTTITLKQSGNSVYSSAVNITRTLTVNAGDGGGNDDDDDGGNDQDIDGDNLALNGIASQSSNHPDGGGEAYKANDGNTSGVYGKGSVTRTSNQENPWWQVDLESEYSIDTINVFGRTDACCNSKLSNFNVIVLDATGNITFTKNFTDAPNPSLSIDTGGVTGQAIKIQQISDGIVLNLAEVEVYGSEIIIVDPPLDTDNLALNGTASQSSNHPDGGGEAYRANDGDTSGRYNDESVTRTDNEENPWWQVVLETPADIETIKIFNRTDSCCSSRLLNFTVFIGDGSGKWVYKETFTTIPDPSFTISDIGVYGRTIRIQTHASSVLNLAEVEVYGNEQSAKTNLEISDLEGVLYTYPNPVNDILNVKINGSETAKIEMFNFAGQKVLTENIDEGSSVLDLSDFSLGIYLLKVTDEKQVQTKKIIKE